MVGIIELRHTEQELHYRAKKWERIARSAIFTTRRVPINHGPASVTGVEIRV